MLRLFAKNGHSPWHNVKITEIYFQEKEKFRENIILERPIESFFSGLGSREFRVQNVRVRVRVRVQ